MRPGAHIESALTEASRGVTSLVLILTKNSAMSSWVRFEVRTALSAKKAKVVGLRFDDTAPPRALRGHVCPDVRTEERLIDALNKIGPARLPLSGAQIVKRFKAQAPLDFAVRLVPTRSLDSARRLGPKDREYVFVGDYAEQCGRTLREVQRDLLFGDSFDRVPRGTEHWTALVFEVGPANRKNVDLLPGTWKAVFRILSSARRLGLFEPSPGEREALGPRPRDYYEGDHNYWYRQITSHQEALTHGGDHRLHQSLSRLFGIDDLCFDGSGITGSQWGRVSTPSRVFLMKNLKLELLQVRRQDLGHPDDGRLLI